MKSTFLSYAIGVASVVRVFLQLFAQRVAYFFHQYASNLLIALVIFLITLIAAHHLFPGALGKLYAQLDAQNSSTAQAWRTFDARCSLSFCRYAFPSPIRFYELEVKEQVGFQSYLAALKAERAKKKQNSASTAAQKFISAYTPSRIAAYGGNPTAAAPENITAIYLTGTSARPAKVDNYLSFNRTQKMNGVVFDMKDVYGFVNYRSALPEVKLTQGKIPPPLGELSPLVAYLKSQKIYTIARVTMFQDELMAMKFPERQIKLQSGGPLLTKGRTVWVDPNKAAVQEYNLRIIREVLQAGVDEIQLDYIRYPAEGDWKIANYHDLKDFADKPVVLGSFLQRVHSLTRAYGAHLSLDVFGVVAWQEALDIKSTGQNMHILAQTADVVSPMLYPSHFGHAFGGVTNPADKPALFLEEGVAKLRAINAHVVIRPWLQAFKWRVTNYTTQYITEQIRGSQKAGGQGYLLWNAGNVYEHFTEPKIQKAQK
ncbi:MAG TPA: putative glycoside hydrolase [Turneriella sp.]|nr:putative glycoside hydrolase [Turneriella sp.]